MASLSELTSLIAGHMPPGAPPRWSAEALNLSFGMATSIPEPSLRVFEPVFALVTQGEKRLVLGDQVFISGKGSFVVVTVDLPLSYQISRASPEEPYFVITMALKPEAIATLLLETERAPFPPEAGVGMGVSDASPDLLDAVLRLVRLLDHPRDLPVLAPLAEKEILWRLLCSEQGHRLRQIGLADSRLSQVSRAMGFMREHYQEACSIEQLAHVAAMSSTSFHRHFRAVTLMSPLQYLKQIRLQAARTRLLASDEDVASIGQAVGYDSPSQFSREYKRAYGAPPAQDARLLRAGSGAG